MMRNRLLLLSLIILASCFKPKPRQPVTYSSGRDQSASIAFNKKLYAQESQRLKNYITHDSLHEYQNSKYGFWYSILNDIDSDIYPEKGDKVTFNYAVYDLDGTEIYTEEMLGTQTYYIEQQEIIQGLQQGLQLLNKGEKVIFLLPSHVAYGYHGDKKDIGSNTPIVIHLELLDLNKSNTN